MIIFVERDVDNIAGLCTEWFYDTVNNHISPIGTSHFLDSNLDPTGKVNEWSPDGTVLYSECIGSTLRQYKYVDNGTHPAPHDPTTITLFQISVVDTVNSSTCCSINATDFSVSKLSNTSAISPNGKILVNSSLFLPGVYEASIDNGATWHGPVGYDHQIPISNLPGGDYTLIIRHVGQICTLIYAVHVSNAYDAAVSSLAVQIIKEPDTFVPVFLPIEFQFRFVNNMFTIQSDGRTYINTADTAIQAFLATLPYLRIVNSVNYNGNVKVNDVDNPTSPTKFYIDAETYVSDEVVSFIPIDRQIFQVFGETAVNVFKKIADIAVAPDSTGLITIRAEGFVQSLFEAQTPAIGDDIGLGRKFYMIPRDYDYDYGSDEFENPVSTAVYGTQDLTPYLDDLTPLGPGPINFIDKITGKGYPVIFSYLNDGNQRVTNVISALETDLTTAGTVASVVALPGNIYTFTWLSPVPIASFTFYPTLPSWITVQSTTTTSITLKIQTYTTASIGDYSVDDYSDADYLIDVINSIVGCYTFEIFDGAISSDEQPLVTLNLCIFPTSQVNPVCGNDLFNIAWINLEGGWNSFIFDGIKAHGREIGTVSTYKKVSELKKASVEEVYDTVEVFYAAKNQRELGFISELRASIQAYLYNDVTQAWDIPIIIDKATFDTYTTPFKQANQSGSFKFSYSNEVIVQRQ